MPKKAKPAPEPTPAVVEAVPITHVPPVNDEGFNVA